MLFWCSCTLGVLVFADFLVFLGSSCRFTARSASMFRRTPILESSIGLSFAIRQRGMSMSLKWTARLTKASMPTCFGTASETGRQRKYIVRGLESANVEFGASFWIPLV